MSMDEKDMDKLADKIAARLSKNKKSKDEDSAGSGKAGKLDKKDATSLGLLVGLGKGKEK